MSTGEATANNRKGKLIFFYEIVIKLKWEADFEDPDLEAVNGTIEIPNLSEENEAHEINVCTFKLRSFLGIKLSLKYYNV